MNMSNLSRFFYCDSSQIDNRIEDGLINAWDIVITSDDNDHRMVMITDNMKQLTIGDISGRAIKVFDSREEADLALINSGNIVVGDLICILEDDHYIPYIVNLDLNGDYTLDTLMNSNFNNLTNIPTLNGTALSGNLNFEDCGLSSISNSQLESILQ